MDCTLLICVYIELCFRGDHPFPPIFWMKFPKSNFPHEQSISPHFKNLILALLTNILFSNKTFCCYWIFESVQNLLRVRIDDYGANADGGKWTFRENGWSPVSGIEKAGDCQFRIAKNSFITDLKIMLACQSENNKTTSRTMKDIRPLCCLIWLLHNSFNLKHIYQLLKYI